MQDVDIAHTMQRFGGSFSKKLAETWMVADDDNRARIQAAFPDFWDKYAELARLLAERDDKDAA
jgi:hypothetical protein